MILISGGSRGIGAACVRAFCREGRDVAFLYENSEEPALALARETGAAAIRADVSDRAQVFAAVRSLADVDVLVNNAGISAFGLFQDMAEADWRRMMDVNLGGAFHLAQAVLPSMIRRKRGAILNVSSIWGIAGASCEVVYSASKAALIGFTRALAKEVGPSGIRVNCVAPGAIDTEMNARLSAGERQALIDETPLGRLGTPEDVAGCLTFLASDSASFITGQVISPNGGLVI